MLPEGNLTLDSILEGILDEEQTAAGTAPPQPPPQPQVAHPHPSQNPPPPPAVTIKTEQTSSSSPTISSSGAAAGAVSAGSSSSSVSMQHHSLDDIPCISIKAELPDSCTAAVDDIMVRKGSADGCRL